MKNRLITGIGAVLFGLLVAIGPQVFFKLCEAKSDGTWMKCHWTGQVEIGVGLLIVILGISILLFSSLQVRLGLSIATFFSGILGFMVPTTLIGGCKMETMVCRAVTFPALTVIFALIIIGFAVNTYYLYRQQAQEVKKQ